MKKINIGEMSRLQIKIPIVLKKQLENVTGSRIIGMQFTKSLIVSIALANLFKTMENSSLEDVYINTYVSFITQRDD